MKLETKIITDFKLGFLLLFMVALFACKAGPTTYIGKTAEEKSRITLQDGSHQAEWKTKDVSAQYSYSRNSDNFQISGQVELGPGLKASSEIVQSFIFQVNFLNAGDIVLDTKDLAIANYRKPFMKWHFDKSFRLPTGTTAIAFSYNGAMGSDRPRESGEPFWHYPFH